MKYSFRLAPSQITVENVKNEGFGWNLMEYPTKYVVIK